MKNTYCYSLDNETFTGEFDSREEALAAAMASVENQSGNKVFTGRNGRPPEASEFLPDPEDITETMAVRACDAYGEHAEDWLSRLTKDQEDRIQAHLNAIAQVIQDSEAPTFWNIEDIEHHQVPA